MKYTCQPTENSLDELGIPKNPYFDPSHDSVASFSRFLEGGHSMPPPIRTALICIPSVKGLKDQKYLEIFQFRFGEGGGSQGKKIKVSKNA